MTVWWGLGFKAGFSLISRGGCGCAGTLSVLIGRVG